MAAATTRSLFVGIALVTLGILVAAANAQDVNLVSAVCNGAKIPGGSAFFSDLGSLLADLQQHTANSGYNYRTSHSGGGLTAWGQATCSNNLSRDQCGSCLSTLGDRIWGICSNAIGGRVQFKDCFIRYEEYNFSVTSQLLLSED